jgi:hypothetical protein
MAISSVISMFTLQFIVSPAGKYISWQVRRLLAAAILSGTA